MEEGIKEYRVSNMSNWSTFWFVLAAPILLFISMKVGSQYGSALYFLVGVGVSTWLMIWFYKYLQQKILVTVSKDGIKIAYLHHPFFDGASDLFITWDDISSYKFQQFNGAVFTLYLNDGRRFSASKGSFGSTVAIEQMAVDIIGVIKERNVANDNGAGKIRSRNTIADGKMGLALAVVAMVVIVMMIIGIFYFPEQHNGGDVIRGIGVIAMCVAFIALVYRKRKRAEQGDGMG